MIKLTDNLIDARKAAFGQPTSDNIKKYDSLLGELVDTENASMFQDDLSACRALLLLETEMQPTKVLSMPNYAGAIINVIKGSTENHLNVTDYVSDLSKSVQYSLVKHREDPSIVANLSTVQNFIATQGFDENATGLRGKGSAAKPTIKQPSFE